MVEGIYSLKLDTPMGELTGKLELKMENGELCGYLETLGTKNKLTGGKQEGNKCAFSGSFNTPMGEITYDILGIVENDKIDIYARN